MQFTTTAILSGDGYKHFGIGRVTARALYCVDPDLIVPVTLVVAEDQSIPTIKQEQQQLRELKTYWGWVDKDGRLGGMVFRTRFMLSICFTYGIEASEAAGNGKAYRFNVLT